MLPPVIVDTNILFSALLKKQNPFAEVLLRYEHSFVVNELVLVELFKHKEKIIRLSKLSEEEVLALLYRLLREIKLFKEDLVSPVHRRTAYALCKDVDETDAPHLALVLELEGLLWSGDEALKAVLKANGFDRFFTP